MARYRIYRHPSPLAPIGAIIAIVFYNYFTTKVDGFVYVIDEASLNLLETLNTRFFGKGQKA